MHDLKVQLILAFVLPEAIFLANIRKENDSAHEQTQNHANEPSSVINLSFFSGLAAYLLNK